MLDEYLQESYLQSRGMRHRRKGFRTLHLNDAYNINERLQEYDKALYIMYNHKEHQWLVMDDVTDTAIMKIPQEGFSTLDERVLTHMRMIDPNNGYNIATVMDYEDKRQVAEEERQQNELIQQLVDDTFQGKIFI